MISININPQTAVPLIVGVGSTILGLLLMLIKIPHSDYSAKLTNSKVAIVTSFLICSFMMFYAMTEFGQPDIEISKKYGLTENNVMVILSRTRTKLKTYLIKEGFWNE